jgi:hypothetical protein
MLLKSIVSLHGPDNLKEPLVQVAFWYTENILWDAQNNPLTEKDRTCLQDLFIVTKVTEPERSRQYEKVNYGFAAYKHGDFSKCSVVL